MRIKLHSPTKLKQTRSAPISDAAWEAHRDSIEYSYIEQNHKLTDVMSELNRKGFFPSKRQMTIRLKRWNITKNTSRKKITRNQPSDLVESAHRSAILSRTMDSRSSAIDDEDAPGVNMITRLRCSDAPGADFECPMTGDLSYTHDTRSVHPERDDEVECGGSQRTSPQQNQNTTQSFFQEDMLQRRFSGSFQNDALTSSSSQHHDESSHSWEDTLVVRSHMNDPIVGRESQSDMDFTSYEWDLDLDLDLEMDMYRDCWDWSDTS